MIARCGIGADRGASCWRSGGPFGLVNHEPRVGLTDAKRRAALELYAGLDVSVAETSVCVVDADSEVIRETKVPTEPEAIIAALAAAGASRKLPISLRSTRRPQRGSPIISNAVIRASTVAFPSVGKGPALAGQDDRGSRPHAP